MALILYPYLPVFIIQPIVPESYFSLILILTWVMEMQRDFIPFIPSNAVQIENWMGSQIW